MFIELLIMNGYGQFVWSAFIFSFLSCSYLFFKTKYELKKQEKIYLLEFSETKSKKIKFTKNSKAAKEVLSIN